MKKTLFTVYLLCALLAATLCTGIPAFAEEPDFEPFKVIWSDALSCTYGDALPAITAVYFDAEGIEHAATVSGLPEPDENGLVNAGSYTLTACTDPSLGHELIGATAAYTVEPTTVKVDWAGVFFSDPFEPFKLTASYLDVLQKRHIIELSLPDADAPSGGYIVTAALNDTNYILDDATRVLVIRDVTLESLEAQQQQNQALQEEKEALEEENQAIKQENQELREQKQSLTDENNALKGANQAILEENAQLSGRIEDLESELGALQAEITALEDEVAALQAEIASLESAAGAMAAELEGLTASNLALKSDVAALVLSNTAMKTELEELKLSNTALEECVTALALLVNDLQTSVSDLTARLGHVKEENAALTKANGVLAQEVFTLQTRLEGLQERVNGLQEQLTANAHNAEAMLASLQGDVAELRAQDKAKILAIVLLAGALLLMAIAICLYLYLCGYFSGDAAGEKDEAPLTAEDCCNIGLGINETIRLAKEMKQAYAANPKGLRAESIENDFDFLVAGLENALPIYSPQIGERFTPSCMLAVEGSATEDSTVKTVLQAGRHIANYFVKPAKVSVKETAQATQN